MWKVQKILSRVDPIEVYLTRPPRAHCVTVLQRDDFARLLAVGLAEGVYVDVGKNKEIMSIAKNLLENEYDWTKEVDCCYVCRHVCATKPNNICSHFDRR